MRTHFAASQACRRPRRTDAGGGCQWLGALRLPNLQLNCSAARRLLNLARDHLSLKRCGPYVRHPREALTHSSRVLRASFRNRRRRRNSASSQEEAEPRQRLRRGDSDKREAAPRKRRKKRERKEKTTKRRRRRRKSRQEATRTAFSSTECVANNSRSACNAFNGEEH